MQHQLDALLATADSAIENTGTIADLEAVRVQYLGKKGELTQLLKGIGKLTPEQRTRVGQQVNDIKVKLQQLLNNRVEYLQQQKLNQQLAKGVDITLPERPYDLGSLHPVSLVTERVVWFFTQLGFYVAQGLEIEDATHNFTALNIPPHHPARSEHDTFYIDGDYLLRTHTSPVQIRELNKHGAPIRLIAPGRVYRQDSDRTHTPMFHQVEGLVIDKQCTMAHLKGLLHDFLQVFFQREIKVRFRASYFPFTEPSAELDMYQPTQDSWLEILGCGMVHPNVLRGVGIDPDEYTGFAFGVGLDRLALLLYGIDDLRLLFENDIRFLREF